ncbi:DUF507 family protein [Myxococcota bacterium]|nr:DUF507 family protein [Myxococcota bacterium]MBU1431706.1 DUF507 family protein [Myxococcota bacterium]MBU1897089.1 DUF507 family protein [Myxococcota bacterium]
MRLYGNKIPSIVKDIVKGLLDAQIVEIEANNIPEVELDIESVLKEYLRAERALTEEAKDLAHSRGLDYSAHQKIKRTLAEKRKFGLYEDSIKYLSDQLLETLLYTHHVEEIYGDDHEVRAVLAPVLKRHMNQNDNLDVEVRKHIKNLQEGTQDWEIRYQQVMERLRAARGEVG